MKILQRPLSVLAACITLALLAGCSSSSSTPTNGYYNSEGKFIPYTSEERQPVTRIPAPNAVEDESAEGETHKVYRTVAIRPYDRTGFYDYNGFYIPLDGGLEIPQDMFPPQGMCRVWFLDRPYEKEPAAESCAGIQSKVPRGAYVVYNGGNGNGNGD